jgi:cytochrome c peroxidase
VARIKAGFALHRWWENLTDGKTMRDRAEPLAAFVREGLVPPPREDRELTPEEQQGKELFTSARTQCATCHVVATEYTDRMAVPLRQKKPPMVYAQDPNPAFKTPSLLYVSGTPPYFHDGSVATLEDLVEKNYDRMGKTSGLKPEERAALVAFLKTL